MPQDSDAGEKTEQPTPKKLQDAREEGQVASSVEVQSAGLLLMGAALLMFGGPLLFDAFAQLTRRSVTDLLRQDITAKTYWLALSHPILNLTIIIAAGTAILFLTAVSLGVLQVGFSFHLKPLIPKFSRVNPMTGFGRLFGMRGLMRLTINVLKLSLIIAVAYVILKNDLPTLCTYRTDLAERLSFACSLAIGLFIKLALVLAAIALLDWMWQRYQMTRDLMMTKQEVKEEYKQSEGDPMVKGRIRQLQRQLAQHRMMEEVPKADVVITNPTHVAVALKYDANSSDAPIVVAKGYDEVAQRIKKIAAEHNIVMVENPPLARALIKEIAIGKRIPVKFFQQVAEVLAYVYRLKKDKKFGGLGG